LRLGWLAFGVCVAALSGCATILGLEHNDGADAGTTKPEEAGRTEMQDATADRDATKLEEAGRTERQSGSADGGLTHDAACRGSFCACVAKDAQFCADFDESLDLNAFVVTTDGGMYDEAGVLTVVSSESFSPPHSLMTVSPMNSFGSVALATHTTETHGGTQYHLRFELRLGECKPFVTGELIATIDVAPVKATLGLYESDAGMPGLLPGQSSSSPLEAPIVVAPNTWTPIEFSLDLATRMETVAIVGGASIVYPLYLPDAGVPATVTMSIGQSSGPSGQCTAYFDNVTFDVQP
jgi:uncharacterized protein YceK